jgi:hypothetical protein
MQCRVIRAYTVWANRPKILSVWANKYIPFGQIDIYCLGEDYLTTNTILMI